MFFFNHLLQERTNFDNMHVYAKVVNIILYWPYRDGVLYTQKIIQRMNKLWEGFPSSEYVNLQSKHTFSSSNRISLTEVN